MSNHFCINHQCTSQTKFDDFDQGQLWKHTIFRVYTHPKCPETGMTESYLPFFSCNNLEQNFQDVMQAVKYRYPQLEEVLGIYSHTRICTSDDEYLLTRQMITQATLISFNPKRKGRGSFLNRRLIKSKLPRKMRKFVNQARKLPLYKFLKIDQDLFDEEKSQRFWQLCNTSDYIGNEIEDFFNSVIIAR